MFLRLMKIHVQPVCRALSIADHRYGQHGGTGSPRPCTAATARLRPCVLEPRGRALGVLPVIPVSRSGRERLFHRHDAKQRQGRQRIFDLATTIRDTALVLRVLRVLRFIEKSHQRLAPTEARKARHALKRALASPWRTWRSLSLGGFLTSRTGAGCPSREPPRPAPTRVGP